MCVCWEGLRAAKSQCVSIIVNQYGKMKLVLNSLLFASLCALSSWSVSSDTLIVTQTRDVSVMEGDSVNISCCWTVLERMNVFWLKNQIQIKTEVIFTIPSQGSVRKETSNCSTLTFTNITKADSGRYICRVIVEIPVLTDARGNGTVITVMNREKTGDNTAGGMNVSIHVLRCLPIIVLLLIFFYLNNRRPKPEQCKPAASGNTPSSVQRREEAQEEEERD